MALIVHCTSSSRLPIKRSTVEAITTITILPVVANQVLNSYIIIMSMNQVPCWRIWFPYDSYETEFLGRTRKVSMISDIQMPHLSGERIQRFIFASNKNINTKDINQ